MKKRTRRTAYQVTTYVYAKDVVEARLLAKKREPHQIAPLVREEPNNQEYIDAYAFLDLPQEWEEEDVPLEDNRIGFKKTA